MNLGTLSKDAVDGTSQPDVDEEGHQASQENRQESAATNRDDEARDFGVCAPNANASREYGCISSSQGTVDPPSREQPENHELAQELSNLPQIRDQENPSLEELQDSGQGHGNLVASEEAVDNVGVVGADAHTPNAPAVRVPSINSFLLPRDQENSSLEELQESGHAHGHFEEAMDIVGVVGVDAHTPNAPAVTVPSINSFPLPGAGNPPSRDLPENHELFLELSSMWRKSDENFMEQQDSLGHRIIPSPNIPIMISGVPHDDQELDPYDSSPDFLNEFQRRSPIGLVLQALLGPENPSLEELQDSGQGHGNLVASEEAVDNVGVVGADAHTPNAPAVRVPSINSFPLPRDQENSSLEELQESGHAHGHFEEAMDIVGVVGVDAHTPNAPAVTVPSINFFPLPGVLQRVPEEDPLSSSPEL